MRRPGVQKSSQPLLFQKSSEPLVPNGSGDLLEEQLRVISLMEE
jgi:hypothetical protein